MRAKYARFKTKRVSAFCPSVSAGNYLVFHDPWCWYSIKLTWMYLHSVNPSSLTPSDAEQVVTNYYIGCYWML